MALTFRTFPAESTLLSFLITAGKGEDVQPPVKVVKKRKCGWTSLDYFLASPFYITFLFYWLARKESTLLF